MSSLIPIDMVMLCSSKSILSHATQGTYTLCEDGITITFSPMGPLPIPQWMEVCGCRDVVNMERDHML